MMTAVIGWLLAILFGGGGVWALWRRSVDAERLRREINEELQRDMLSKAKEAKQREAKILAEPNADKRTTLRRMRQNRDKG